MILERKEGKERNINWLPPICAPARDGTHQLRMNPDWGSNLQPFGVPADAPATQPGLGLPF